MKDTILSVIRHVLTFGGGLAVSAGFLTDHTVAALAGGIPTFIGLLWGALDEYRAARAAKAAKTNA